MLDTYMIVKDEGYNDDFSVVSWFKTVDFEYAERFFASWVKENGEPNDHHLLVEVVDEAQRG